MASSSTSSLSRRSSNSSLTELLPVDVDGNNALHRAAKSNDIALLKSLLSTQSGLASINVGDSNNRTPLAWACVYGYYELAEILFQHGCNYWQADNGRREPLDHVRENFHTEMLQLWAIYHMGKEDGLQESWTPRELAECFCQHGIAARLKDWEEGIRAFGTTNVEVDEMDGSELDGLMDMFGEE